MCSMIADATPTATNNEIAWVNALLARRPARVVTVAVANKLARIVWAIMQRGGTFRERPFGIA